MALIPPPYMDAVVALGVYDQKGEPDWVASGFLYGDFIRPLDGDQNEYRVYLVTNRHVLEAKHEICVRCNPQAQQPARTYHANLVGDDGKPLWVGSSSDGADVAVLPINIQLLKKEGMRVNYFRSNHNVAVIDEMNELGVTEGDFAYVLGFPMGLVGEERNFVIVRSGSIARVRDALDGASAEFLVDAFIFPGNSGGPVILKPEMVAITGTKRVSTAYLIGVVAGFLSYPEDAVSVQTGRLRVRFEDNSGLAAVHPIDFVQEAIEEYRKTLGADEGPVAVATVEETTPQD
jgi:S1-C subfamily serine protease